MSYSRSSNITFFIRCKLRLLFCNHKRNYKLFKNEDGDVIGYKFDDVTVSKEEHAVDVKKAKMIIALFSIALIRAIELFDLKQIFAFR